MHFRTVTSNIQISGNMGSGWVHMLLGCNTILHQAPELTNSRWIRSIKQRGNKLDEYGFTVELNGATYYFDTPELVIIGKNGKVAYYSDTTCWNEPGYSKPHYERVH